MNNLMNKFNVLNQYFFRPDGFMVYYILLMVLLCLAYFRNNSNKNYVDFLILIILVIFGSIKSLISTDMLGYHNYYLSYNKLSFYDIEPFFYFISHILNLFNLSINYVFFVYALITYFFLILSLRKNNEVFVYSLFIYMTVPGLFLSSYGALMRQLAALSVCLYCFFLLLERRYIVYLLLSMFAFTLHYTSLVPTLIFPVIVSFSYKFNFFKKQMLYILLLLVSLSVTLVPKIVDFMFSSQQLLNITKYSVYLNFFEHVDILKLFINNSLFLIIFLISLTKSYSFVQENRKVYIMIILFSLGIVILNSFKNYAPISRLYFYFSIFQMFIIPYLIKYITVKNSYKIVLYILFGMYYVMSFTYGLTYIDPATKKTVFVPYKNIFMGD